MRDKSLDVSRNVLNPAIISYSAVIETTVFHNKHKPSRAVMFIIISVRTSKTITDILSREHNTDLDSQSYSKQNHNKHNIYPAPRFILTLSYRDNAGILYLRKELINLSSIGFAWL